jgi:hypothetical protein
MKLSLLWTVAQVESTVSSRFSALSTVFKGDWLNIIHQHSSSISTYIQQMYIVQMYREEICNCRTITMLAEASAFCTGTCCFLLTAGHTDHLSLTITREIGLSGHMGGQNEVNTGVCQLILARFTLFITLLLVLSISLTFCLLFK